jgi:hypothetical protein
MNRRRDQQPTDRIENDELLLQIESYLRKPHYQSVFRLCIQGYNAQEIAKELSWPYKRAQRVARAVKREVVAWYETNSDINLQAIQKLLAPKPQSTIDNRQEPRTKNQEPRTKNQEPRTNGLRKIGFVRLSYKTGCFWLNESRLGSSLNCRFMVR